MDTKLLSTLLWHLFHFVQEEKEWTTLFTLPLDHVEESYLVQYLTAQNQDDERTHLAWSCLFAYYLQRGRYAEAAALHHHRLSTSAHVDNTDTGRLRAALLDNFALLLPRVERSQYMALTPAAATSFTPATARGTSVASSNMSPASLSSITTRVTRDVQTTTTPQRKEHESSALTPSHTSRLFRFVIHFSFSSFHSR